MAKGSVSSRPRAFFDSIEKGESGFLRHPASIPNAILLITSVVRRPNSLEKIQ